MWIGHKNSFKVIALLPECCGFLKSHNKKRSRKSIADSTVFSNHRDRTKPAVCRVAGGRIHNVPVSLSVLFKVAFVTTGSDDCLIGNRKDHHGSIAGRVLDPHLPWRSIRFTSNGLHIPAKVQEGGSHTFFAEQLGSELSTVSLCNTSKINGHSFWNGYISCSSIILDLCIINKREKGFNLCFLRNLIFFRSKSPCTYDRINRNIQCTVCAYAHF